MAATTEPSASRAKLGRSSLFQIAAVCCLLLAFSAWNQHSLHRHQIERDKLIKKIQSMQKQLVAQQSDQMQVQWAHEEHKEFAMDEEQIRELKGKLAERQTALDACLKGTGKKEKGLRGSSRRQRSLLTRLSATRSA